MQFERKREIMDNLLLFAQKESLNEKQKKAFLKIVKELPKGTNLQKERFIMYFGLDKTKCKNTDFNRLQENYKKVPKKQRTRIDFKPFLFLRHIVCCL